MRVLVAEDEQKMLEFLKRGLESVSIAVDTASDGEQALYLASVSDYDAILLDVMMPKMTGIEVCRKLRTKGLKTPIIIVSSQGAVVDRVTGLDSGADDYLPKPFSFAELSARIRAVVRRKDSIQKPDIEVGELVVNSNRRTVTRNGKAIKLSPKQYRLLEYFVRNRGKVLSRFDILENVWGSGESLFSNVVDVHMSHLRNKLNKGFDEELLKTVRGEGYILE